MRCARGRSGRVTPSADRRRNHRHHKSNMPHLNLEAFESNCFLSALGYCQLGSFAARRGRNQKEPSVETTKVPDTNGTVEDSELEEWVLQASAIALPDRR